MTPSPDSAAYGEPSPLAATVRTWWVILKTCIHERLTYRADFAFGTLIRFLPIVTQMFLWTAVYGTVGSSSRLNGYALDDMIAYFLLTMVARAFSSMPGLSNSIAREIRDGSVKRYLTQPVDLLGYYFWSRAAHKLVYHAIAAGPFALVFFLCRGYFHDSISAGQWAAFAASLLMAFLIGFLLEALVGLVAFWFLEVSSLLFIFMMLNYFLSGHMVPLDWFPAPWGDWFRWLPFQYLAYFPCAVLLGRIPSEDLAFHLAVEAGWVAILVAANRAALLYGLRRYSAYGG
jgi:ABC-2 type transport system permease protein